jgi:hypothetical protein
MRHRKPSKPHTNLIRAGVLTTALAAGSFLGSGTALAGTAGHGPDNYYDPDVVDADDVVDVDYVQVEDVVDVGVDLIDSTS